jgi:hypothetical protein
VDSQSLDQGGGLLGMRRPSRPHHANVRNGSRADSSDLASATVKRDFHSAGTGRRFVLASSSAM